MSEITKFVKKYNNKKYKRQYNNKHVISNINQKKLINDNLTSIEADKSSTTVIIGNNELEEKTLSFLNDINCTKLTKRSYQ